MSLLNICLQIICLVCFSSSKIINFISNSKAARDNRGLIVSKFTFHGNQANAKLRGNDSIGGLYFFPRSKILNDHYDGDCNMLLRKASFSLFPTKSATKFRERKFPLWNQEAQTFYVLFVDAATCYHQYPYQNNVALELHLFNDDSSGGHLSVEENGLKTAHLLLSLLFLVGSVWFGISLYSILSRGGSMVLVMQLFIGVCVTQGLSLILPALHWIWYEANGSGVPFLCTMAHLLALACDAMMYGLVIDIVLGWTLGSSKRVSSSRSEKVLGCVAIVGIVHIIAHFAVASIDTNDPSYYAYSSIRELLTGLLGLVEGGMFLLVLAGTYQQDRSALRQDFYSSFAWIIITWYISYPSAQFTVLFMAEHNRVKIMVAISHFLRCCGLFQLAGLFIRRSLFWEVSSLSAASLPFATRSFAAKKQDDGVSYHGCEKLTKRK